MITFAKKWIGVDLVSLCPLQMLLKCFHLTWKGRIEVLEGGLPTREICHLYLFGSDVNIFIKAMMHKYKFDQLFFFLIL